MLARVRPYILLFLGLNVVYHANLRPIDASDTLPASLIPFSIVLDHSITLRRFAPWLRGHVWYSRYVTHKKHDHVFSSYPIGAPVLLSPLYLPAAFIGLRNWDPESLVILARIVEKFVSAAVAALSAVLLLLLLERITSRGWAWALTLVYALATETWAISSQALWQHGPGELAIVGALLAFECWASRPSRDHCLWICGACVAAAITIRPTNAVLLPALAVGLYLAKPSTRQWIALFAPCVVIGGLLAAYNWHVFQRLSGGYAASGAHKSWLGATAGLLVSPSRGILIYTPVVLFAIFAFLPRAAAARHRQRPLFVAAASLLFLLLAAISASTSLSPSVVWWGGYCWGPRMLTELAPPLIVLMAFGVATIDQPWVRRAFATLAIYSMSTQVVGVFFYPNGHWDGLPEPINATGGRLWDWRDNPVARTIRGGFYWEPYAIVGAGMTGGLSAAAQRMRDLNVNPYEQAQPKKVSRPKRGLP
ncbi:MAG TPA: hypothetical protein VFW44_19135 [Bryobacteraceae bacterium]|nr:hypothetical protein [Bryobacteraceae bacterium]